MKISHLIYFSAACFIILFLSGCLPEEKNKEQFYSSAQTFFENGKYNEARIQLKNALKVDPRYAKAHELLAETQLKLKNPADAFKTYLRLEQLQPENPETKIRLATIYLLGKKPVEAEKRVNLVLKDDPENIEALYLHAGILTHKKESLTEIRKIYEKILKIDPEQTKACLAMAGILTSRKRYRQAEVYLLKASELEPDNMAIDRTVFRFYLAGNRIGDARKVLDRLAVKNPDSAEPMIMLGNFLTMQKRTDEAEDAFLEAIEKDPSSVSAYMLLARIYNNQKKIQKAENTIKKALEAAPEDFVVKNAYADFLFTHNRVKAAETLIDGILQERPDYIPSKVIKGKILASRKEYEKAESIFRSLVKEEPESPVFNFLLGYILLETGKVERALTPITEAVSRNPDFHQARLLVAEIHLRKGNLVISESEIRRVLNAQPENYKANILLGNVYMAKKEFDKAETVFKERIEKFPQISEAYVRMGMLKRLQQKHADALTHFEKALDINPDLMNVISGITTLHALNGDLNKAHAVCDRYVQKDDPVTAAAAHFLKGNLCIRTGEYAKAENQFKEAIRKNPAFIRPHIALADLLQSTDRVDEAIGKYKELIEKEPGRAVLHSVLGSLYERKEMYDLAENHYKKALNIDSEFIPAINNLAYLFAERGKDLNQAMDLARKAKEKMWDAPAIMDTLGWVYYKKGLYDSAISEFKGCIEKNPENPIFYYHLGLAYNKKWEYNDAESALKKALSLDENFKGAETAKSILAQIE